MRPCSVWLASDSLWPARTTWLLATIGRWRSGPKDRLSSKVLSSVFTVVVPAFAFGQKMRRTGSSNTASFGTSSSNRTHDSTVIGCGNPVDMVEHSARRRGRPRGPRGERAARGARLIINSCLHRCSYCTVGKFCLHACCPKRWLPAVHGPWSYPDSDADREWVRARAAEHTLSGTIWVHEHEGSSWVRNQATRRI